MILANIEPDKWQEIFIAYDNMCHLDGLKAARQPLPWAAPWDKVWSSVNKIIDSLHISNHKDQRCHQLYHPSQLQDLHPNDNTMAAEQTLVWLSRFKKIVCAMPKVHHLFYLHRMVRRRNAYTVHCYKKGHKPVLPKSRQ